MKTIFKSAVVLALFVSTAIVSLHVLAGIKSSQTTITPPKALISHRLIVKFRPKAMPAGPSAAQINEAMSRPLSASDMGQMTGVAGVTLKELNTLPHGAHVLALPSAPSRQVLVQTISAIASLPDVEYVEEDRIMTIQLVPNDTNYSTGLVGNPGLWAMQPVSPVALPAPGGTGNYGADFQTAWDTNTGTGVVVAVMDTGITPHDDIVGSGGTVSPATGNLVSAGYDFTTDCRMRGTCPASTSTGSEVVAPSANATDLGDFISSTDAASSFFSSLGCSSISSSSWHGTHVSGTIAAIGNNHNSVVGGAFNAKILPVRVMGKCGGFTSDIANGILWAAGVHPTITNPNPAKVINLSLGGSGACGTTFQDAINSAIAAGTTVVVAAGNADPGGVDVATVSPANCNNVISVASIGRDGSRAYYSNFSSPNSNLTPVSVTLAAQGGDQSYPATFDPGILSTLNSGTTTAVSPSLSYYQGTSMATPHVVAAVALMRSRNPTLTPTQVKAILSSTSSLTAFPSFVSGFLTWDCATNHNCGSGILSAKLAVQNSQPLTLSSPSSDFGLVSLNVTTSLNLTLTNSTLQSFVTGANTITGTNSAFFHIASNTCQNATLSVNASCQITINYTPTASGNHSATLNIATNAFTDVSTAIVLTGSALAGPPPASGGGGGGGCTVMPAGAIPDWSLILVSLLVLACWLTRRALDQRRED